MARYAVAHVSDLPPGSRLIVEIAGRSIGIFNVEHRLYALRNRCPHSGGPLCEGGAVYSLYESSRPGEYTINPLRKFVTCPWHGWEYDLATGQSWFDPAGSRVRAYAVSVVPGAEASGDERSVETAGRLQGPYVAETYNVDVDDSLIVVEVPD